MRSASASRTTATRWLSISCSTFHPSASDASHVARYGGRDRQSPWSVEDIVALIDAREPPPKPRGICKPRQSKATKINNRRARGAKIRSVVVSPLSVSIAASCSSSQNFGLSKGTNRVFNVENWKFLRSASISTTALCWARKCYWRRQPRICCQERLHDLQSPSYKGDTLQGSSFRLSVLDHKSNPSSRGHYSYP